MNFVNRIGGALEWRLDQAVSPVLGKFRSPELVTPFNSMILLNNLGRSGGTLFSRLIDGHPEIASLPYPVRFEVSNSSYHEVWPQVVPTEYAEGSDAIFWQRVIFDPRWRIFARRGLSKRWDNSSNRVSHEFTVSPSRHYAAFRSHVERLSHSHERLPARILAGYAAYFDSWQEWKGSRSASRIFLQTADHEDSAQVTHNVISTIPDARVVTVLREPASWLASYMSIRQNREQPTELISRYRKFTEGLIASAENVERGSHAVIRFETLVGNVEPVMTSMAKMLGVAFEPSLIIPTLNGVPTSANSSFPDASPTTGVVDPRMADRRARLCEADQKLVDEVAAPAHRASIAALRDHGHLVE